MRVCIYGPSGAGKTTLAKILSRALCHKLDLIHGDDFIKEHSNDWDGLEAVLKGTASYIFDHVSSLSILHQCGIKPDLSIGIRFTAGSAPHDQPLADDVFYSKQSSLSQINGWSSIDSDSIRNAISPALNFFAASGLFPNPISNFIVKIASRCNLNCSYCYMYQALDTSYASAPVAMPLEVASQLGKRLAEHYDYCHLSKLAVILHGGEPLSLRPDVFRSIISAIQEPLVGRNVIFSVQTNGTRITDDYLRILDELGLQIGISLDGKDAAANRHRVYHSGASAYSDILAGITSCLNYKFKKGCFGGVLCVIDPLASGKATYRHLRRLGLDSFDFLLRDEHHLFAPGGQTTEVSASRFLCEAFDEWMVDPDPCDIRLFSALISLSVGAGFSTDSLGLYPMNALGVSASGEWELLDILRICFKDAWRTPFRVSDHSVSTVAASEEFARLYKWQYDLSDSCLKCNRLVICGGGYLPHRYHKDTMFRNVSSHCDAIFNLISHIENRIKEDWEITHAIRTTTEPKPPQCNAGSRPSSGDPSASETPSSLGPSG